MVVTDSNFGGTKVPTYVCLGFEPSATFGRVRKSRSKSNTGPGGCQVRSHHK